MNKEEMEKIFNWISEKCPQAGFQEKLAHIELIAAAYFNETLLPNPKSLDEIIKLYEKEKLKNG